MDNDILKEFISESSELLDKCRVALENFNTSGDAKYFEEFGLYIDRIMGTAATIDLKELAEISCLGKELGYKGSQVEQIDRLLALSGLMSQIIAYVEKSLKRFKKKKFEPPENFETLKEKLKLASQHLGDLRGTVKIE
jgi:hypothetical protein